MGSGRLCLGEVTHVASGAVVPVDRPRCVAPGPAPPAPRLATHRNRQDYLLL